MPGAGSTRFQLFQAAHVQAPPAVLLRQLQQLDTEESVPVLASLLQNPALFARVLEYQSKASYPPPGFQQRLERLEPAWLIRTLRNSALQQFMWNEQSHIPFICLHWRLSRYMALVAQALANACSHPQADTVAGSAFLLRAGMLVLQQQHGPAYTTLALAHTDQTQLLHHEQAVFGIDHILAGKRLFETWQLEPFCIDAMQYPGLPAEAVVDAVPLVKICWFANHLVNNQDTDREPLATLAAALFKISRPALHEMLGGVQLQYARECIAYGMMAESSEIPVETGSLQTERLKHYVVSSSMLGALRGQLPAMADSLKTLLINLLVEAGLEPTFMVFAKNRINPAFHLVTCNNVHHHSADLTFECAPGRSALSEIIVDGGFLISGGYAALSDTTFILTSRELTVIDRQLLSSLGGQAVLCEAVPANGTVRAVLLLGMPFSSGNQYLARADIRQIIRRKIADFIKSQSEDQLPPTTAAYQQRVREAVHEVNNPLTIIKNYLQLLSIRQSGEAGTHADITLIKSEIDRVARILIALREPREITVRPQQININQLLEQMRVMFTSAAGADKHVAIIFDLAPLHPRVWGKPDALKQILTNLVKNAAEAINNSGSIKLLTCGNVYFNDEKFVRLCVADDGPGIDSQILPQLFTAGVSTKGYLNTGTGLAIVSKLVADMQGHISCQSDNRGTVFSILLPQAS